ncbi:MAG: hypothetical protein EXX96DRAFT_539325 [Benjaminiella poitrasii]|nr:MAG: hypothetical protein EXX96DRAFT_539325 [Benjaminiella poitrasii]
MQLIAISTLKIQFPETFKRLYVANQGRAQDSLLKEKSRILYSKVADITDKALDIVKETTMREVDALRHYKLMCYSSKSINHAPNQPNLSTTHIGSVEKKYFITMSSFPLFIMPTFLREALSNNRTDQKALNSPKSFPNALRIIKHMMEGDIDNNTFPQTLWNFQAQALMKNSVEKGFFSIVAIPLTDFW